MNPLAAYLESKLRKGAAAFLLSALDSRERRIEGRKWELDLFNAGVKVDLDAWERRALKVARRGLENVRKSANMPGGNR